MAKLRTEAIADQIAYDLGHQGVLITQQFLRNHVRVGDENSLQKRESVLMTRMRGANTHHVSAILLGFGIFTIALFVDYAIIHEFWTRILSNEFGEVPQSLANTVASKSLQVLFATLSVHYLISNIGHPGRVVYSLLIFVVTAFMVVGIGLLWANESLPANSKVFGFDVNQSTQSLDNFAKSLGVSAPRKASLPAEVKLLKKYEILIWLTSLGLIFLVVASIGALALHTAMRGFAGWTGGASYDTHHEAMQGRRMRAEYARVQVDKQSPDSTRSVSAMITDFIASYTVGVIDKRFSPSRTGRLLEWMTRAAEEVEQQIAGEHPENANS